MFNKTRRRIVLAIVLSLVALMVVTLATIFISNRLAAERENFEMLRTYVERYSLNAQGQGKGSMGSPGGRGPMNDEYRFRLSTFYSVAFSMDGQVLEVNGGDSGLQSRDELLTLAQGFLDSGRDRGTGGNMAFMVERRESYTLVAMLDMGLTDLSQQTLIRQMLLVGIPALAVLVVLAVLIARRIVRPLEENDARQRQFISDAGHELKTPIAVMSANTELLRRQLGQSEWLDNIEYENGRMKDLVKQLLDLSRAERGDAARERVDFSRLTEGEALPFESLAFEKGRSLESSIRPDIFVAGNPNQLRQLVSILLDNALAHGTGGPIELSLRAERHRAVLEVKNPAEELKKEQLEHLFDRFYRTDQARTDTGGHYGLGLSIARAVAESHGGSIRASWQEGKAVFTAEIPIVL